MSFFNELNNILNIATVKLTSNGNICKLLSYYPEHVDLKFDPLTKPTIKKPQSLLMKYIFPMPKIPDAETEQICLINVNISGADAYPNNSGFRKVYLTFDIICHLDSWMIKGGYRPLKIVSEIDSMFNNQLTDLPIVNRPFAKSLQPIRYSNKFYGYQVTYELSVNSNVECGKR